MPQIETVDNERTSEKSSDASVIVRGKKKNVFVPIEVLRNKAMENLQIKEKRVHFTVGEIKKIENLLNSFRPQSYENYLGVIAQIQKDIQLNYLKYDSLAMWLDVDGLSKYEPTLIRNIARECGL